MMLVMPHRLILYDTIEIPKEWLIYVRREVQPFWNNLKLFQGMPTGTVQAVQTVQTVQGMSCLPAFPKMDTASVKPLVLLLCFWLRYIAVSADEDEVWLHGICAKFPLVGARMRWFQSLSGNRKKVRPYVPSCSFFQNPNGYNRLLDAFGTIYGNET